MTSKHSDKVRNSKQQSTLLLENNAWNMNELESINILICSLKSLYIPDYIKKMSTLRSPNQTERAIDAASIRSFLLLGFLFLYPEFLEQDKW